MSVTVESACQTRSTRNKIMSQFGTHILTLAHTLTHTLTYVGAYTKCASGHNFELIGVRTSVIFRAKRVLFYLVPW